MESSTTPAAASERPSPVYHWIVTIQLANGVMMTHDGTHVPAASTTRGECFHAIVKALKDKHKVEQLAVLFYDLALNDMSGAL